MSMDNPVKYYVVDIVAPYAIPEAGSNLVRDRDKLPVWEAISDTNWGKEDAPELPSAQGAGWAVAVVGSNFDSGLWYHDLSDRREIQIKTKRDDQIEKIRRLPDVSVREVPPSNLYMISVSTYSHHQMEEKVRLVQENGLHGDADFSKKVLKEFDEKVWPMTKKAIFATIDKYDPKGLEYDTDFIGIVLNTKCENLIRALLSIDQVILIEQPPLTTLAELTQIYENRQLQKAKAKLPLDKAFNLKVDGPPC